MSSTAWWKAALMLLTPVYFAAEKIQGT